MVKVAEKVVKRHATFNLYNYKTSICNMTGNTCIHKTKCKNKKARAQK